MLLTVAMELVVLWYIRDNLTLNILMLVYPLDSIKHWQGWASLIAVRGAKNAAQGSGVQTHSHVLTSPRPADTTRRGRCSRSLSPGRSLHRPKT